MPIRLIEDKEGVRLMLKVVPGASRDRVMGELGDALKVAVSKPPQDGAANEAVVALLARSLDIPRRNVRIIRGHTSPRKEIRITGITLQALQNRLNELL